MLYFLTAVVLDFLFQFLFCLFYEPIADVEVLHCVNDEELLENGV